jgi:hypothetical protein
VKRIGPELKMPDLKNAKVPPFLSDLYLDLRDRRLLPLVGLVLVGIVAMPFLLGSGSEDPEPAPESIGGTAESAQTSSLTVVEAHPGLRDYRKRLAGRTPTDPFKQRYSGPAGVGGLPDVVSSESNSSSSGDAGATVTSPSTPSSPTESAPEPAPESVPPSDGGSDVEPGELRLFTFAADVRISSTRTKANGKKEKTEPEVMKEVVPPTALPSAKTQVVTFMGISPKTRNPLLLVSDDVEAIFGEPNCLSGSEFCQLLEVELGLPTTFVYEPTGARFKINVLKIEPVFKGRYEG